MRNSRPGTGVAEERQAAGDQRLVVRVDDLDLLGDPIPLQHLAVDGVAHEAPHRRRERRRRWRPRPCRRPGTPRPAGTRTARPPATNASTAPGSTGSAPLSAMRIGDRSRSGQPPQRPGGQHPGEVRAGGGRAPVARQPLHPVAGVGQEVLGGGLDEVDPVEHGDAEAADQPHVVVEGQPGHEDVVVARARPPRRRRRCWRRAPGPGSSRPWARCVDPLVYCRMTSRSGSSARDLERFGPGVAGAGQHRRPAGRVGGSPGTGLVERGQQVVDQDQLGVAVADAGPGRLDEGVERAHAHRQGQHHATPRRPASSPGWR